MVMMKISGTYTMWIIWLQGTIWRSSSESNWVSFEKLSNLNQFSSEKMKRRYYFEKKKKKLQQNLNECKNFLKNPSKLSNNWLMMGNNLTNI